MLHFVRGPGLYLFFLFHELPVRFERLLRFSWFFLVLLLNRTLDSYFFLPFELSSTFQHYSQLNVQFILSIFCKQVKRFLALPSHNLDKVYFTEHYTREVYVSILLINELNLNNSYTYWIVFLNSLLSSYNNAVSRPMNNDFIIVLITLIDSVVSHCIRLFCTSCSSRISLRRICATSNSAMWGNLSLADRS